MKKQTEAYIQNQIYIWFHNMYPYYIIHAVPNGGFRNTAEDAASCAGLTLLVVFLQKL
jgi:hypothetical protein